MSRRSRWVKPSDKARHWKGTLDWQEYVNKESATEMGNEAVTHKKKSSELPKQDLEEEDWTTANRDENIF